MLWVRKSRMITRWLLLPGSVLVLAGLFFTIIAFSTHEQIVDAQIVNFYSDTCEGGWEHAMHATGEPTVSDEHSPLTLENSAYLEGTTSPLTCFGFAGTLPPQTYHTRVQVRFSWHQEQLKIIPKDESVPDDAGEESVPDSVSATLTDVATATPTVDTSDSPNDSVPVDVEVEDSAGSSTVATTTTSELKEEPKTEHSTSSSEGTSEVIIVEPVTTEPVVTPHEAAPTEIESEPEIETVAPVEIEPVAPAEVEAAPISWLRSRLVPTVYAEEMALSPISEVADPYVESSTPSTTSSYGEDQGTTTVDVALEVVEATSSSTVAEGAQFMVEYTLDAVTWVTLGMITSVDNDVRLEFGVEVLATIDDISKVQLRITPLAAETVSPVYVDALWLEVSYAPVGELGVHQISEIVPTISPITEVIADEFTDASSTVPQSTSADFIDRIRWIHGIDERYVLITLAVTATSSEVWLFDMRDEMIHHIGIGEAEIGVMPAGIKDGMIFWLNATQEKIFTYDLRTAGSLHEMLLVKNLPPGRLYRLTFPFTNWELIWRGDRFYFFSRKTGEVFQDENTYSAQRFFEYFPLLTSLPLARIQEIGGTFVSESDMVQRETPPQDSE